MIDHYPFAQDWMAQGCRPIGTGEGKHDGTWKDFQRRDPTGTERHRWWTGKRQTNANIALILGPTPGGDLLGININVENGHDGPGTLKRLGWDRLIPPTPTIRTPSTGLFIAFKVPDPQLYPFPFNTYVHPQGYEGLEFRGTGGYQLVPPSRTKDGAYTFVEPWTLERFREQLADLPGAILQAWVRLDRGAKVGRNFGADEPKIISNARKRPSAAAFPTDLSPSSHSKPQKRSQARPAPKAQATTPNYTTITTRLSNDECRLFVEGFDLRERECAEAICQRLSLPVDSLDDGQHFLCRLPGHRERDPSAMWGRTETGYYIYKDFHGKSGETVYTLPEVFAAVTSGVVKSLPRSSRMVWRLRLMVEEGWLEPEPVPMKPVPDDASDLLRHYCEGFRFLVACKSCHPQTAPNAATVFAPSFAALWCGLRKGSIWSAHQEALARDLIVFAGIYKKQALYRPGKDE